MTDPLPVDVRPNAVDWTTALGTVGATLLAVIAISMQLRDRRKLADDERRRQAGLVAAWMSAEPIDGMTNASGEVMAWDHYAHVRNGSDGPVYDVWLHPLDRERVQSVEVGVVSPQAERKFSADPSVGDPWTIPFELDFVDARDVTGPETPMVDSSMADGRLRRMCEVGSGACHPATVFRRAGVC